MKNYILLAKNFSEKAIKEFLSADGDEDKIRQSAEKGWLAVLYATNALFEKKGIKLPKGARSREDLLFELERKDKRVNELSIIDRYKNFLFTLHIECFYEGDFSIKIVRRYLDKIKNYIDDIEKI